MSTSQRQLILGALLLVIGFVCGFYAGREGAAPAAVAAAPVVGEAPPGEMGMPPPHRGHTFTGKIDVPPHSEEAHQLADVLLADVPCPCGGCKNQNIGQCGCDTAREIGGVAAHLLERGNTGDVVLAKLTTRYTLAVSDAVRAKAATMRLANPQLVDGGATEGGPAPTPADAIPPDIENLLNQPGVQRLTDVPTGARPHP